MFFTKILQRLFPPKYIPIPGSERRMLEHYASLMYIKHCEFVKVSEWFI